MEYPNFLKRDSTRPERRRAGTVTDRPRLLNM